MYPCTHWNTTGQDRMKIDGGAIVKETEYRQFTPCHVNQELSRAKIPINTPIPRDALTPL